MVSSWPTSADLRDAQVVSYPGISCRSQLQGEYSYSVALHGVGLGPSFLQTTVSTLIRLRLSDALHGRCFPLRPPLVRG
jgi:hypothetical protein